MADRFWFGSSFGHEYSAALLHGRHRSSMALRVPIRRSPEGRYQRPTVPEVPCKSEPRVRAPPLVALGAPLNAEGYHGPC
jgi:hypothetical protein